MLNWLTYVWTTRLIDLSAIDALWLLTQAALGLLILSSAGSALRTALQNRRKVKA